MGSISCEQYELYGLEIEGKVHSCNGKSVCCLCPYCDKIACTNCGGLGIFFDHSCDVIKRVEGPDYFIYINIDKFNEANNPNKQNNRNSENE